MSSHLFEEIEGTCDRIGIIKQGKLISIMDSTDVLQFDKTTYKIQFLNKQDFESIQKKDFAFRDIQSEHLQVIIDIEDIHINELLLVLSQLRVKSIHETKNSLEEYFMGFYKGVDNYENI